jgi:triosephosphate isomerase
MKRRKLIAANWKMNLDFDKAVQLAEDVKEGAKNSNCDVLLFPAFPYIAEVKKKAGERIKVGAQNCSHCENGAYTGEVSAQMLASMDVEYVIIGHSERREYFNETHDIIRRKLETAFRHRLKPVFCCGEPLDVRNSNNQEVYVQLQLEESLFGFTDDEVANTIIAYEPVWAIGTGLNASPEQAQQMQGFIRDRIAKKFSNELANSIRIIYGGSCKPDNARPLFGCPDVDGGLIGGASLNAKDFLTIIRSA